MIMQNQHQYKNEYLARSKHYKAKKIWNGDNHANRCFRVGLIILLNEAILIRQLMIMLIHHQYKNEN